MTTYSLKSFLNSPRLPWAKPNDTNPPMQLPDYQITGTPQFQPVQVKAQLWDAANKAWFPFFNLVTRGRGTLS